MEVVIKGRQVHWLLEFPIQHLLLLLRVFCKELHLTNPDLAQDNRFTDWRNTIDAAFTTLTVKTILLMLFCVRSNNQIFYEVLQRQLYWETQFLFKRHPRAIQTNTFIFNSSEQWKILYTTCNKSMNISKALLRYSLNSFSFAHIQNIEWFMHRSKSSNKLK